MNIDIIRTSISRYEIFKVSHLSLKHHLKYSGNLRWILHEHILHPERSKKLVDYAKQEGYEVKVALPLMDSIISQWHALKWLLSQVKTKYCFLMEDDWRVIKDIDLDMAVKIMEENPDVNQICFNKRPIMSQKKEFIKKEVKRSGCSLTTNTYFTVLPSLVRTSFIPIDVLPDKLTCRLGHGLHRFLMNYWFKDYKENKDADWVINNAGHYMLGSPLSNHKQKLLNGEITEDEYNSIDNGCYVIHLGQHPYKPDEWPFPIPLPPKVKNTLCGNRTNRWYIGDVKWNPSVYYPDAEYADWHNFKTYDKNTF